MSEYRNTFGPKMSVFGYGRWYWFARANSSKAVVAEMDGRRKAKEIELRQIAGTAVSARSSVRDRERAEEEWRGIQDLEHH
jgi:hypothetical protein